MKRQRFKRIVPLILVIIILGGTVLGIVGMVLSTTAYAATVTAELDTLDYQIVDDLGNVMDLPDGMIKKGQSVNILITVVDPTQILDPTAPSPRLVARLTSQSAFQTKGNNIFLGAVQSAPNSDPYYADKLCYTILFKNVIYRGGSYTDILYSVETTDSSGGNYLIYGYKYISETNPPNPTTSAPVDNNNNNNNNGNNNGNNDGSASRPEIKIPAPATPHIIVSEYNYGGGDVVAGQSFNLTIRFTNTSNRIINDNILLKVTTPEAFTLTNSSNTFYIPGLRPGEIKEQTLTLSVKANADAASQAIKLAFSFEAIIQDERKAFTSEEEISIPIVQRDRFMFSSMDLPESMYVKEETPVTFKFVNKGRTEVYNITTQIKGNFLENEQILYFGNLAVGKEGKVEFYITPSEEGDLTGELVITYEDLNMNIKTLNVPFNSLAEGMEKPMMPDIAVDVLPEDPVPATFEWTTQNIVWTSVIGVVLLIAVILIAKKIMSSSSGDQDHEEF